MKLRVFTSMLLAMSYCTQLNAQSFLENIGQSIKKEIKKEVKQKVEKEV